MKAPIPEKLEFLINRGARFKSPWGGRAGLKSWSCARAALIIGRNHPIRVGCAREIQSSIRDSVHQLLRDQIALLGMDGWWNVTDNSITGPNGTSFAFVGLRHNVQSIKSMEGVDVFWIEEAQSVSQESWDTVEPTIFRKRGAEIWASWNPMLETDPTYKKFIVNPPPDAIVVKTSWRDNPWLPDDLRVQMEHLKATDPAAYAHVWEGECRSSVEGAVYGEELREAEKQGRITSVAVDRTRAVDTFWDLGYGDSTAIWLAQALESGQIRVVDYLENRGKTLEWYVIQLQQKGYVYGTDYLPHDGVDALLHTRLGGGDRSRSPEQLLRAAGRNVRIVPKMHVASGINAMRTILPNCWFDRERCADGLMALRHYQWGPASVAGIERREPLHDWSSHAADAARTMAVSIRYPEARTERRDPRMYGTWGGRTGSAAWMA